MCLLGGLLLSLSAWSQTPKVVPGEYLIKYRVDIGSSQVISKIQSKVNLKAAFPEMNMLHFSVKPGQESAINDIKNDPEVLFVEPNYILEKLDEERPGEVVDRLSMSEVQMQSSLSFSQNYAAVRVEQAWSVSSPYAVNKRPIVAILDTGMDGQHDLFRRTNALWINQKEIPGNGIDDDQNGYIDDINGWNFISNSANFADDEGHGTHVAGIVIGAGLDIFSPQLDQSKIQIMPLKFLDAHGAGSTSNAVKAIYYAVNNGAKIINNSWGGPGYSSALLEALSYAYNQQVLIVSAAGNSAKNNDSNEMYPANYIVPSNISIAASSDTDRLASFSNFGVQMVHISSPGVYIYSSLPGNMFGSMSGTSMAAPFVSGIAALALREAPSLTGYQLKKLIISTSVQVGPLSGKIQSGSRVDAYSLVSQAKSNVQTAASQPDYKPLYAETREPASEAQAAPKSSGGCGLVSTALMNQFGRGGGGGGMTPANAVSLALILSLPLAYYFYMRASRPASRRKHDRFVMKSDIKVNIGGRELVAHMNTISMGGISFNVDEMLEKGGSLTMKIKGPDGAEVEVEGRVVWSEANQSYGVKFSEAKQGISQTIESWTNQLVKSDN
ncbi:MAG: S8 family serine peptidase [Bdellovibrionaceae bacterium]|nr:S8 family serine peptidase [Pseudobdellovibrionaceae bacterium]